jgi:hypothetical protein
VSDAIPKHLILCFNVGPSNIFSIENMEDQRREGDEQAEYDPDGSDWCCQPMYSSRGTRIKHVKAAFSVSPPVFKW